MSNINILEPNNHSWELCHKTNTIHPCRELPDRRTFELLPRASDLGLMICSVEGRVVVSKVKTYSIAGEDGKVERGDVIDELGKDDHNKASLTIQHTFYLYFFYSFSI